MIEEKEFKLMFMNCVTSRLRCRLRLQELVRGGNATAGFVFECFLCFGLLWSLLGQKRRVERGIHFSEQDLDKSRNVRAVIGDEDGN